MAFKIQTVVYPSSSFAWTILGLPGVVLRPRFHGQVLFLRVAPAGFVGFPDPSNPHNPFEHETWAKFIAVVTDWVRTGARAALFAPRPVQQLLELHVIKRGNPYAPSLQGSLHRQASTVLAFS